MTTLVPPAPVPTVLPAGEPCGPADVRLAASVADRYPESPEHRPAQLPLTARAEEFDPWQAAAVRGEPPAGQA